MIEIFHGLIKKIHGGASRLTPAMIWFSCVFIIALVLRCVAWSRTSVIIPDGVLYIFQAKAIFYGQWSAINDCGGFKLVSIYPFLIAAGYNFFPDWVIVGTAINFVFGVATLIPLYLLLRQFFDYRISAVAALIIAVCPLFVGVSVSVLRDPIYWFFSTLGLYLFTASINRGDKRLFLFLSSLCFLMATWTRIEAIVLFVISLAYLLWKDRCLSKIIIFTSPVVAAIALALVAGSYLNMSIFELQRVNDVVKGTLNSLSNYVALKNEIKELEKGLNGQAHRMLKFFLPEARTNMWLVALGMLLNRVLETFLYVLIVPAIIGLSKLKNIKKDNRFSYFLLLISSALFVMYLSIIVKWILEYRYVVIFALPSIIFAGVGLEAIVKWFNTRYNVKEPILILILAFMIILFPLPKNLCSGESDKMVFREIGELIAKNEGGNSQEIIVSASKDTQRWISFYANLNYKGAICPEASAQTCWEIFAKQDSLLEQFKQRGIKYFLWTEKNWSAKNINITKYYKYIKELGRWEHPDTGKMILYKVL